MFPPPIWLYFGSNDFAGENIETQYVSFSLGRDSCDSGSNSGSDGDTDSDSDSYSGWLRFNLQLGFMMAQNYRAGEYIHFK